MKHEKGVVFILVLLALTTVILLGGTFVQFGINQQKFSEFDNQGTQAFYMAESAVDRGLAWLRSQLIPPQGITPVVLFGGWNTLQTGTGNGAFLARVIPDPGNLTSPIKRYTVEGRGVSGTVANPTAARQTSLVVQTESFASYAYFTNNERSYPGNGRVYFISGDRVEGPTHTNGQFSMYKRPVFDGPVSSVASSIYYYRGQRFTQPVFNGGLSLGVPVREFPSEFPDSVISAAQNGGTVLEGDTEVMLLRDGTMQVTNEDAGWVE